LCPILLRFHFTGFSDSVYSHSKVACLMPNLPPGGPNLCIYVPQW
jgi:hypothetical protein